MPHTFADLIAFSSLTITSVFVPQSQSRTPETRALNWRVTLHRNDHQVLTTDYTAGVAHCPSYSKLKGLKTTLHNDAVLGFECENGRNAPHTFTSGTTGYRGGDPIVPNATDVIYNLVRDADAIDHPDFESWAEDFGYDPDSRKAEALYRLCLDLALRLRSRLGEPLFTQLREASSEY